MNKFDFQSVHEGLSRFPNLRAMARMFLRSLTLLLAKLPTMFYNKDSHVQESLQGGSLPCCPEGLCCQCQARP